MARIFCCWWLFFLTAAAAQEARSGGGTGAVLQAQPVPGVDAGANWLLMRGGPGVPGELRSWGGREVFLLFPPAAQAAFPERRDSSLLVVLDPGHGGAQKGAVGVGGFTEKDFTLEAAHQLARELSRDGEVQVFLTRTGDEDVSLWRRVEMANELRADLFISIHANALARPEIGGLETFFHSLQATGEEARRVAGYENAPAGGQAAPADTLAFILQDIRQTERLRSSGQLAAILHRRLTGALAWEDRGVMQADFIVLRGTEMPSVLLELGFVTCARDVALLSLPASREKIASAAAAGILEFGKLLRRKQGRLEASR